MKKRLSDKNKTVPKPLADKKENRAKKNALLKARAQAFRNKAKKGLAQAKRALPWWPCLIWAVAAAAGAPLWWARIFLNGLRAPPFLPAGRVLGLLYATGVLCAGAGILLAFLQKRRQKREREKKTIAPLYARAAGAAQNNRRPTPGLLLFGITAAALVWWSGFLLIGWREVSFLGLLAADILYPLACKKYKPAVLGWMLSPLLLVMWFLTALQYCLILLN